MRPSFFLAALVGGAAAFPSIKDLKAAVARRQFSSSTELLGDLATLPDNKLSKVGKDIKAILLGEGEGQSTVGYKAPPMDSKRCKEDECCIWKYIAEEMYGMMYDEATDKCNDFARGSIRMGFHDAAAWDKFQPYGGADGSILLSDELTRFENTALNPTGNTMRTLFDKYKGYGISMADFIQCGAKVGALACPGGPRVRMFIGRPDNSKAAPENLLPPPFLNAEQIIDLFANKTVGPGGIVALVGAHTTSNNHPPNGGPVLPQDKTPGKWDTEYFDEQLRVNGSSGVTRFISDVSLARDPVTGPVFQQFAVQKSSWDEAYAKEYIRMSLMGVKKINGMKECTKAMPKGDEGSGEPEPSSSSSSSGPEPSSSSPSSSSSSSYKHTHSPSYSTSTVYESSTITITSCPPEKTDCPYGPHNPLTTTTVYPVSTTVCEVTPTSYPEDEPAYPVDDPESEPEYPDTLTSPSASEPTKKVTPVTPVTAGASHITGGLLAAAAGLLAAFL